MVIAAGVEPLDNTVGPEDLDTTSGAKDLETTAPWTDVKNKRAKKAKCNMVNRTKRERSGR